MIVITLKLMQITDAFGCKGGEGGCPVLIRSLSGKPLMGNCLHRARARSDRALLRWVRLIRTLKRLRRLQRLFHHSGLRLQRVQRRLLNRLSRRLR